MRSYISDCMKLATFCETSSLFTVQVSFIDSVNDDVIIEGHMSSKTTDRK